MNRPPIMMCKKCHKEKPLRSLFDGCCIEFVCTDCVPEDKGWLKEILDQAKESQ